MTVRDDPFALKPPDHDARSDADFVGKRLDGLVTVKPLKILFALIGDQQVGREAVSVLLPRVILVVHVDVGLLLAVVQNVAALVEKGEPEPIVALTTKIEADHRLAS